ncbi:MAG: TonB-dependent receptor [Bryobacteraceae bacterium]
MNPLKHKGAMFALLLVFAVSAWAQLDTGTIAGRVSDATGAVVANAQISIVQTDTNFETLSQTNEEGLYRAQSLRPGPYRVTVTAPGFKRFVREGMNLRVGDVMELNLALEVGAVTESVDVADTLPLLDTEISATGALVQGAYLYELPNYKREVYKSLFYEPGVTYTGGPSSDGGYGGMHVAGNPFGVTGTYEDGQLNSIGASGNVMNGVEEVKLLTSTIPAEYGHSAGGAVTVVKKTGTNDLHGIASMYGRTRRMQHRKFFDEYRTSQVVPGYGAAEGLLFFQPDANISGPVYIPKVYDGRNKTFFMFGWQWQIEKQPKQQVSTVPSVAELGGDFSFGGIGQPVYDPHSFAQLANGTWTSTPFPNNVIPPSEWSRVAQNILALKPYVLPNAPGSLTSTGPQNNEYSNPWKLYREDNWTLRIDQEFTPNLKAYGSWTRQTDWIRQKPWTIAADSIFDSSQNLGYPVNQIASTGLVWVISPSFITDIRGGIYRAYSHTIDIAQNQNFASIYGIPGLSPAYAPQGVGPSGFTENINIGGPSTSVSENLTFRDDTTKIYGQHAFKWGYELLRNRQDNNSPGNPDGSFNYTGTSGLQSNGTAIPNTGNSFANFLIGGVNSDSFNYNLMASLPRNWEHSFYAQDDWKIDPKLTLNIGVRYELETPPVQKLGRFSVFNPYAPDTSTYTSCPAGGCGSFLGAWEHPTSGYPYNMQHNRFDPRIGLAWHPAPKWVVRSGFSVTHLDLGLGYLYTNELITQATSQSQAVGNPMPLFYIYQGPPAIVYPALRADNSVPFVGSPGSNSANIIEQNLHAPYTIGWNANVQYQVRKDYMVEVRYVGQKEVAGTGSYDTDQLPFGMIPNPNGSGWLNLNDPANAAFRNSWLSTAQYSRFYPGYGSVPMNGNDGRMTHHEGTVKLEKRYSKGLNFLTFYTYQRTLTDNALSSPYLNWDLNKGRPGYDQQMNFTGSMTYELPVGKGRKFLNRGGVLNTLLGGYNLVWTYTITSGNPTGIGISGSSSIQYPGYMSTYGNVMLLQNPMLRNNWQDLGTNRFNQNSQNSMINCGFDGSFQVGWGNSCFAAMPSFTNGTNGVNVFTAQRAIAASVSASKEVQIWERLRLQIRWDFQNPFKWYNLANPNTTLAINSVSNSKSFGTTSVGGEATSTQYGGLPCMNLTIAFKW